MREITFAQALTGIVEGTGLNKTQIDDTQQVRATYNTSLLDQIQKVISIPAVTGAIITTVGAGLAAIIAAVINQSIRRRQEYIEASRYKMDSITKLKAYYIQLANYYSTISSILRYTLEYGRWTTDYTLLLYYICCVRFIYKRIFSQVGDLQLDDLEVEKVIKKLQDSINIIMSKDGFFTHETIDPDWKGLKSWKTYHYYMKKMSLEFVSILSAGLGLFLLSTIQVSA
ncbi:MAG TPA: hypothetical protein VKA95_03790, partial [Nitrososphaeraceae archaeon]|nr:hypothetical protein [Nitrososphaeraceae archaeon]